MIEAIDASVVQLGFVGLALLLLLVRCVFRLVIGHLKLVSQ